MKVLQDLLKSFLLVNFYTVEYMSTMITEESEFLLNNINHMTNLTTFTASIVDLKQGSFN